MRSDPTFYFQGLLVYLSFSLSLTAVAWGQQHKSDNLHTKQKRSDQKRTKSHINVVLMVVLNLKIRKGLQTKMLLYSTLFSPLSQLVHRMTQEVIFGKRFWTF